MPKHTERAQGRGGDAIQPPAHFVGRLASGLARASVPWALVSADGVWAWAPDHGELVALTDLAHDKQLFFSMSCLSPDGTRLTYGHRNSNGQYSPPGPRRITYDLRTANTHIEAASKEVKFDSADGHRLKVEYVDHVNGSASGSHYTLAPRDDQDVYELPMRDLLGHNMSGPAAQFSPDCGALAISHSSSSGPTPHVSVIHLESGEIRRYPELRLGGSSSWDRSGSRLVVTRGQRRHPAVLNIVSGDVSGLESLLSKPELANPPVSVVGWLDDEWILATQVRGPRLRVLWISVESGAQREILDLPMPASSRSTYGVVMAPGLAQSRPQLTGYPPSPRAVIGS